MAQLTLGGRHRPHSRSRVGIRITTRLACLGIPVVAAAGAVLAGLYGRLVVVEGHSMEPALGAGTIVWARKLDRPVRRGDIVVARVLGQWVVKRVAGVAGDRYTIGSVARSYRVKPGFVYLLGDCQQRSFDSRVYGQVAESDIHYRIESGSTYLADREPGVAEQVVTPVGYGESIK